MLSRRCLATMALAFVSLATTACADLTRPNEITIKAEPPPAPAAPAPAAAAAAAAPGGQGAAPGGGG